MDKKKKNSVKDITELLKRTQANFENYRKQQEKRIQEIQEQANKNLIIQILPILDNFELALKNIEARKEDFIKGIELIYSQLFTMLEDNGVKSIETDDKKFDPNLHEALIKIDSDEPENLIIEELQKGFLLNNKVIRPARVKISSGKKKDDKDNGGK